MYGIGGASVGLVELAVAGDILNKTTKNSGVKQKQVKYNAKKKDSFFGV